MVIVGGGECGTHAAVTLRHRGFEGSITIISAEDKPAYERPPLSKSVIIEDDSQPVHPYSADDLIDHSVTLVTGVRVDTLHREEHRITLSDRRSLRYERLLLATGARARTLPVPDAGVHYLRTHSEALAIRAVLVAGARILVVGAGLIGLELAAAAVARGCHVTVVEAATRSLGRAVPAAVADEVVALHQDHSVDFRWSTEVLSIERSGGESVVRLGDGSALRVDAVLAGIGATPNTAEAAASGLAVADGIIVDEYLRTADESVFAAGDCARYRHPRSGGGHIRVESWRNALDSARVAATSMIGDTVAHDAVPWFWSDQYGHTLQVAGLPALAERTVVRERPDGLRIRLGLDSDRKLVSASGFGPGSAVAKDIRAAEILMREGAEPDVTELVDPALPLLKLRPARRATAT